MEMEMDGDGDGRVGSAPATGAFRACSTATVTVQIVAAWRPALEAGPNHPPTYSQYEYEYIPQYHNPYPSQSTSLSSLTLLSPSFAPHRSPPGTSLPVARVCPLSPAQSLSPSEKTNR